MMATFVFLGSSVKFNRLLMTPQTPRITKAPRKPNTERAENTENAENGVWGPQEEILFSSSFKILLFFSLFSKVTRPLAYVIKATSALLPFLSASYYAATPGWSVIPAQYKTKATTAQVRISYFHCLMSSSSG
jgi:hypothetical protein